MIFNPDFTIQEKIETLQRWILVHSYIYYEMDTNVVSDHVYNSNTQQLLKFRKDYPEVYEQSRYYPYFDDFESGTGFDLMYRVKDDPELHVKIRRDAEHAIHWRDNGGPSGVKQPKKAKKPFLFDYQMDAVKKMRTGCILNGGVGSGKSRTGLYYYFKEQGGSIDPDYNPMKNPRDLYIITTAMKRDKKEWEAELANFLISTNPKASLYKELNVVIDSWNNIKKYADVTNAFFIFDEDRVTGTGVWVKTFYKIAKSNEWIILSATPGDTWEQYIPVFVANGFYRNKTDFINQHVKYDPRCKTYPKIIGYYGTGRLIRLRNRILIDMDFERQTVPHHEDVYVGYDTTIYKQTMRTRWDPYKNEPIQQASGLCYVLRKIVNSDESRQTALLQLVEDHPKAIIFYSFDYELDILKNLYYGEDVEIAEWNGHVHQEIPRSEKFVYLVQYTAGCEGWNYVGTDTIIFYSQHYSYKVMTQAAGRIDRLNTPYRDLYYYHLKSRSGIDLAISKALSEKKQFNETRWVKW